MPDFTKRKSGGQHGRLSESLGCSDIDMRRVHQRAEFELGRETGSVGDHKEEEFQSSSANDV